MLSEQPTIHPTALVIDSKFGQWTAVGERSSLTESVLGDYSYVVDDVHIIYSEIGKFCAIATQSRINPGNHPMWRAALHHFTYRSVWYGLADEEDDEFFDWRRKHRVILENDVWIGHGATIMPGVRLGTGSAVGAGAVVTKDVLPFEIVVGVPAKHLRWRFEEPVRERLLQLAWWDWSRDRLREALADFRKLSGEEFVEKYQA
jgi:phosphonate metabolism protein (transferase hexapeptide repeat family)